MAIAPTNAHIAQELKHDSPLIGCHFDPKGRYVFVSAQDSTLQRFDLKTQAKTACLGHKSWVRGMASLPKTDLLISGDYHGQMLWWDIAAETPKPLRTVTAHEGWVRALTVSPNGQWIASCGNDHLVKLWDAATGQPVRTLAGHADHVYHVAFHPDGQHIVSADLKGVLKVWDAVSGAHLRDWDGAVLHAFDTNFVAHIGGVRSMAFDPTGARVACAGITNVSNAFAGVGNPIVVVFDWKTGKPTQLKPKEAFQGTAWGVRFHPDGFILAAGGGRGGAVWFWNGTGTINTHTVKVPVSGRDLDLHPNGESFCVAGANGIAYLYSLQPAPPKAKPEPKPKAKKK
ncbi:MAG: WD40 repeat domain-containing protein [Bacteroidales bacterium]|nr:WD40 repeat domain-containing protein [Bacteroidales bacterium]